MHHDEFDRDKLSKLTFAVLLGWQCCLADPALDDPSASEFRQAAERAGRALSTDPVIVEHAVILFRGHPPVAVWRSELELLRALGQVVAGMHDAEVPLLIATAARIERLRMGQMRGRGVECPWRRAFEDGAGVVLGESDARNVARVLDRHIAVVPARERLGTKRCARMSMKDLAKVAQVGDAAAVVVTGEADRARHEAHVERPSTDARARRRPSSPRMGNSEPLVPARRSRSDVSET